METIIFIFYLVLFSYLLTKIPFFKNSGISKIVLIVLFNLKIIAGIAYARFYLLPKNYATSDTWRFYKLSITETDWLLKDPIAFVSDLFTFGYSNAGNLFSGRDSFWNDLKSNMIIKIMAIVNVFTNKSYYCNIILFNFLFVAGLVALFKTFYNLYPQKKWQIITGIFLLPSTLFWCSGIHKDGLILSSVGIIIYSFSKFLIRKKPKYLIATLFFSLLVFTLRNYILLALIPSLLLWLLTNRFNNHKALVTSLFFAFGIFFIFVLPYVIPALNFPGIIVNKQQEFLQLQSSSQVVTKHLDATFISFLNYLPTALDMAFLQPHLTEIKTISYLPAIIEAMLITLVIVLSVFFINRKVSVPGFIICCFTFSITVLIICGYTIPFIGAIVRYKSLALPLFVTPLLCITSLPDDVFRKFITQYRRISNQSTETP